MAGRGWLLSSIAAIGLACVTLGQVSDPGLREGTGASGKPLKKNPGGTPGSHRASPAPMSPEFDEVRRSIEALTPEQRVRLEENLRRWLNFPPERKHDLRVRAEERKKQAANDIENAVKEAGLEFDKEQRQQFAKRYSEERRKIEEQLRAEIEQKRKPLVKEMLGRLKEEFSQQGSAPPGKPPGVATPPASVP